MVEYEHAKGAKQYQLDLCRLELADLPPNPPMPVMPPVVVGPIPEPKVEVKKEEEVKAPAPPKSKKFDIAFMIDCTVSMTDWIKRASETAETILNAMKNVNGVEMEVRAAVVGYTDYDEPVRFYIEPFT